MRLVLQTYAVEDVRISDETSFEQGTLSVGREELTRLILEDDAIADAHIELARPGESVRIVHVLDAVEPRCKSGGNAVCFPGFLGRPGTVGQGTTNRMSGVSVVVTGAKMHLPIAGDTGVLEFNEGLIDMSGPGKDLSACSDSINICLCLTMREDLPIAQFTNSVTMAGLKTADHLARLTLGRKPDAVETLSTGVADPDLPRVVYINQIQSQGLMCRTYLYGMPMEGFFTPTLLHPNELADGAVVSQNYRNLMRCCTRMQQNNSVARELYSRHGKEVNFMGMVMSRGHYDDQAMKHRSGCYAANLAKMLGADIAILTIEGTGNSNIDYMETVCALERAGIIAVPIMHEFGGPRGDGPIAVLIPPEAKSLISGGACEAHSPMPAMERVIGGDMVKFTMSFDGAPAAFDPHQAFMGSALHYFCGNRSLQDNGYRCIEH